MEYIELKELEWQDGIPWAWSKLEPAQICASPIRDPSIEGDYRDVDDCWCPGRELNPHSRCREEDFKCPRLTTLDHYNRVFGMVYSTSDKAGQTAVRLV